MSVIAKRKTLVQDQPETVGISLGFPLKGRRAMNYEKLVKLRDTMRNLDLQTLEGDDADAEKFSADYGISLRDAHYIMGKLRDRYDVSFVADRISKVLNHENYERSSFDDLKARDRRYN